MITLFDNLLYPTRSSVLVVSDTQLAEFKRANTEAEIAELQKLVDSHKQSIERLNVTIDKLQATLPQSSTAE